MLKKNHYLASLLAVGLAVPTAWAATPHVITSGYLMADGSFWVWGPKKPMHQVASDVVKIEPTQGGFVKTDGSLWAIATAATLTVSGNIGYACNKNADVCPVGQGSVKDLWSGGVLKADGTVWTNGGYGGGFAATLPVTPTTAHAVMTDVSEYISTQADISAAVYFRKANGEIWGYGRFSPGCDDVNGLPQYNCVPQYLGRDFSQISANSLNVTVGVKNGAIYGWGRDLNNVLRNGTPPTVKPNVNVKSSTTPRQLDTTIDNRYVAVDGTGQNIFVIKNDNSLWAWGTNICGILADGTTTPRAEPVKIGDGYQDVAVDNNGLGYAHVVALKMDGSVWTWGCSALNRLGDGSTVDRKTPTQISFGPTQQIPVTDVLPSFAATVSGPAGAQTVAVDLVKGSRFPSSVSPGQSDGLYGLSRVFIAVYLPGAGVFLLGPNGYVPLDVNNPVAAGVSWETSILMPTAPQVQTHYVLAQNIDLTGLPGIEIYAGFGRAGNAGPDGVEYISTIYPDTGGKPFTDYAATPFYALNDMLAVGNFQRIYPTGN